MNRYDAFISLASEDKKTAKMVVEELRTRYNLSCWVYYEHIKGGQNYQDLIPSAIDDSAVTVVLISEYSVSSTEVPKEVAIAEKAGKQIIPYWISKTEYKGSFRYNLTALDYIDATDAPAGKDNIKALADAINLQENEKSHMEKAADEETAELISIIEGFIERETNTEQKKSSPKSADSKKTLDAEKRRNIKKMVISILIFAIVLFAFGARMLLRLKDYIPPQVILSAPKFSTGMVEFTVSIGEEPGDFLVNLKDDDVETKGFTGNLEIVDKGKTQVLRFTELEMENEECSIVLHEGIAVDASNNKSASLESEKFYLDITPPAVSISPEDKDKVITEGDTAVYLVAFGDNNEIAAVSLTKRNIVMCGFEADIKVEKTGAVTRKIIFSNIKFTDDHTEKYFEISAGVAADTYGNLNTPLRMYLKAE